MDACVVVDALYEFEAHATCWGICGGRNALDALLDVEDHFHVRAPLGHDEGAQFCVIQFVQTMHIIEVDVKLNGYPFILGYNHTKRSNVLPTSYGLGVAFRGYPSLINGNEHHMHDD